MLTSQELCENQDLWKPRTVAMPASPFKIGQHVRRKAPNRNLVMRVTACGIGSNTVTCVWNSPCGNCGMLVCQSDELEAVCGSDGCDVGWIKSRSRNYQSDDYSTTWARCQYCDTKAIPPAPEPHKPPPPPPPLTVSYDLVNNKCVQVTGSEGEFKSLGDCEARIKHGVADQPAPKPTTGTPVWELVIADMKARDKTGRKRYGTPLQAHNGRDALVDAYQEALDLSVYLRTAIEERTSTPKPKRILFCGKARAGKDTACAMLAEITGLRNAGTVSKYIAPHMAQELGISVEEAHVMRERGDMSPEMRAKWRAKGDKLRVHDPALLVREMMANGEIGGGVRGRAEIQAARKEGLADLFVWVASWRAMADTTCEFGEEECDVVIKNDDSLDEFRERLRRLAVFAGMVKG